MNTPNRIEGCTDDAPKPSGPYSQAVIMGSLVAVAGQVGADPMTGQIISEDVGMQTRQAFANVTAALRSCGLTLNDVICVDVFLASLGDRAKMNEEYARLFELPYPARTTVEAGLSPGVKVEVKVLAIAS